MMKTVYRLPETAILVALTLLVPVVAAAQSDVAFPKEVYIARRARLASHVPDADVIIVPGRYQIAPGDELMKQDPNFWYLTGVESPFAVLVMWRDRASAAPAVRWRSALFLPTEYQFAGAQYPTADSAFRRAVWNRPRRRLVPGAASITATGVDETSPVDSFVPRFRQLSGGAHVIYGPLGPPLYAPPGIQDPISLGDQLVNSAALLIPNSDLRDLTPVVTRMRMVKDQLEITALRQAARIAGVGLIEAMRATRPGINDREIAGLMEFVWKREGSPRASFPPIVMSGPNSMTLFTLQRERYNAIDHVMQAGDLAFIDYGAAEWMTYTSDLCRTIPVSGRFTPEQRTYYDIVLEAQEAAIAAIQPGAMMVDVIKKAAAVYRSHDLERFEDVAAMGTDHVWGLMPSPTHYLARNGGLTRYSAAGTGVRDLGHFVGLEATDGRDYSQPLVAGMVLTIEPKLYIPDKQIAIMIEDEVLVTPNGHEVLSVNVPKRAADIERVMAEGRRANAWRPPPPPARRRP